MFNVTYLGLLLNPSRAAMNEMYDHGLDLYDISEVLEQGYNCAKSRRASDTIEKCLDIVTDSNFDQRSKFRDNACRKEARSDPFCLSHRTRTTRVVIARSYNFALETEVWVITHVGITVKHEVRT